MDNQDRNPKNYSASRLCCYVPGEQPLERHARRVASSWQGESIVRAWCEHRSIRFFIYQRECPHPHGPYWDFKVLLVKGAAVARWHPGVGRFIRIAFLTGRRSKQGYKCAKVYDWEELLILLESWFAEIPRGEL